MRFHIIANNECMFQAVDQGYRQRNKDVCVCFHLEYKQLVMKWFNDSFVKGISFSSNKM